MAVNPNLTEMGTLARRTVLDQLQGCGSRRLSVSSPVVCVVFRGWVDNSVSERSSGSRCNGGQAANVGCWMDHVRPSETAR